MTTKGGIPAQDTRPTRAEAREAQKRAILGGDTAAPAAAGAPAPASGDRLAELLGLVPSAAPDPDEVREPFTTRIKRGNKKRLDRVIGAAKANGRTIVKGDLVDLAIERLLDELENPGHD